jgi:hypothetical protein
VVDLAPAKAGSAVVTDLGNDMTRGTENVSGIQRMSRHRRGGRQWRVENGRGHGSPTGVSTWSSIGWRISNCSQPDRECITLSDRSSRRTSDSPHPAASARSVSRSSLHPRDGTGLHHTWPDRRALVAQRGTNDGPPYWSYQGPGMAWNGSSGPGWKTTAAGNWYTCWIGTA